MYSIADLEQAKAARAAVESKWERYSGNNPDKYRGERNSARRQVEIIEAALKADGTLPRSEHEVVEAELDRLYPEARTRDIVEHNGRRYQRQFTPAERSRKGKVKGWIKQWIPLDP